MTRRKSVCLKWTLVLFVALLCPYVYSRPQDNVTTPISSIVNKSTESPIRYRHKNVTLSLHKLGIPIILDVSDKHSFKETSPKRAYNITTSKSYVPILGTNNAPSTKIINNRKSRLISKTVTNNYKNSNTLKHSISPKIRNNSTPSWKNKPTIKKVITKWTDDPKYEDIDFNYETTISNEQDRTTLNSVDSTEDYNSVEEHSTEVSKKNIRQKPNKIKRVTKRPKPDYSEETQIYSDNVHVINSSPQLSTRPIYIFNTPSPTPIISNVGNPKPWSRPNFHATYHTVNTQRPVVVTKPPKKHHNYHNSVYNNYPPYPGHEFEVTTFQPTNAYTDRIIIRPEEYNASPDECPTIFLTLNNTFQGQGKEACPDLNIAVNTNVINKNVVVDSEEEEGDGDGGIFADAFGIPFDDESGEEAESNHGFFGSNENQEQVESESASIEGLSYTNYNAASEGGSSEPGGVASPSQILSSYHKPSSSHDEDTFSISSFVKFFKPAINALGWLATINPFSFGLFSLFLAPIVFLFAGTSGIAALFAPWAFSAREAPKVVHVYRPHWHWDDEIKTWHLHSFPRNRNWNPTLSRSSKDKESTNNDSIKPTLFYKIKEWMKNATQRLRTNMNKNLHHRKNKRKKRETWTTRIKASNQDANEEKVKQENSTTATSATPESSRDVKTKGPIIRDSIKLVANQLLDKPANNTVETPIVSDTRIPPKLKNQLAQKHKIKTRNEDEPIENAHAGIAVPMTMEELESENKVSESSTSNEGISTWILLSNPSNATIVSTEPTRVDESQKKQKPTTPKNKNKRPQTNKVPAVKRPIIGSTNKADLVAGGSAINENVYNKIKDTVLTNVQKNKNTPVPRTTTTTTTTVAPTTEDVTTTKETITKASTSIIPVVKVTSKPSKKKNKNKNKTSTTPAPVQEVQESALLPMEPKEQEIELEVSTPPTTTKKPKRSSTRKKNKTKKRKTSKPKPDTETSVSEIKTTNKTKSTKTKKPSNPTGPITTQIYNYLSREVMPSVGVGVIGLASLVGLASYFFYPFSTPVRRTFEVDKKDDLYRNNAEEYANEGNGQAEEEMLGTVLAGMPAHSKQKLNPYAGQTHINRYAVKKEPDNIRYRHVATSYDPNYNAHYPQQKTGIAHGAVYSKPYNYDPQQYETRNVYTTESKYVYDNSQTSYTPSYPAVEPIYAAPQTGPSAISSYGNDAANSVVYGVKPTADTDFRPVYPFEGKIYSETTSNPVTYPPTSMYLGSNNDSEEPEQDKYDENSESNEPVDNKFVVGNVPKELVDSVTPAVVPEHGPRNLRRKRSVINRRRIRGNIEEMLKEANKDVFISNEIDDLPGMLISNLASPTEPAPINKEVTSTPENKEVFTVYATSLDPTKENGFDTNAPDLLNDVLIENVSTLPIDNDREKSTTESEVETTTKSFRVYEVFINDSKDTEQKSQTEQAETTTQFKNMMTETTTEVKSETTSTMPPSPSPISETKLPPQSPVRPRPKPTMHPEVITYPPLNQEGGFFSFLKRLVEFKYRLGLSILQTTSENLNRYLRSMEDSMQKVAKASQ